MVGIEGGWGVWDALSVVNVTDGVLLVVEDVVESAVGEEEVGILVGMVVLWWLITCGTSTVVVVGIDVYDGANVVGKNDGNEDNDEEYPIRLNST